MSDETANNQGRVGSETARELAAGLFIHVKPDGTWLIFDCGALKAALRLESLAEERGHIIGDAIATWCEMFRATPEAHDAQLVADLTKQKDGAYKERDQLVCALSKLFPASLERHPEEDLTWENDWREASVRIQSVELPNASGPITLNKDWDVSKCLLCEREERERALAVGAALEALAEKFFNIQPNGTAFNAYRIAEMIRSEIPEASKKALAERNRALLAPLVEAARNFAARVEERCPSWFREEEGSTDFSEADHTLRAAIAKAKEGRQ